MIRKLLFITSFIILNTIIFYLTESNKKQRIELSLDSNLKDLETHFNVLAKKMSDDMDAVYKRVSENEEIINILQKSIKETDKNNLSIYRKELYQIAQKHYRYMKIKGIYQLHFVLPDNTSFLRLHKPQNYGDNLDDIRDDYIKVHKSKKVFEGVTAGKTISSFRRVYPIFDKNKHYLGLVDIAYPTTYIQDELTQTSNLHSHLLIHKHLFENKIWKSNIGEKYNKSLENDDYILVVTKDHTEHQQEYLLKNNLKYHTNLIKEKMDTNRKFVLYFKDDTNDTFRVLSFLPLSSSEEKIKSWLVSYNNDSFIKSTLSIVNTVRIVFFFLFLIIFYILYKQMAQKDELILKTENIRLKNIELENIRNNIEQERTKYKNLMEYSSDAIFISNMEGYIVECSRQTENLIGYERDEILKLHIIDFEASHSKEQILQNIEKIQYKPISFETTFRKKDGNIINIDISIAKVKINNTDHAYASCRDITAQKKLSDELQENKNELQIILETIPSMIFIKDAKELRFTHLNKAGESLLGINKNDILGKNDYDFFPKEQADFFISKDKDTLISGKSTDIKEEIIDTIHGQKILHTKKVTINDSNGNPKYLLGISEDITEQKRLSSVLEELNKTLEQKVDEKTKELQIKSDELETYFNTMQDGLGIAEVATKKFINCNKAFEELTGYTKEEMQKFTIDNFFKEDSLEYVFEQFEKTAKGEILVAKDLPVLHKNGTVTLCDVYTKHYIIEGNIYNIGVFRNITDRKLLETNLQHEKEQAEDAANTKSIFLANMSHEIRTPLNAILGFVQILKDDEKNDEKLKYLSTIDNSSKSLLSIINDILDFSKIESGKIELDNVNFNTYREFESVADLFKPLCKEKELIFTVNIDNTMPKYLNADIQKIRQVLSNLLSNAIKFTPKGKNIEFALSYKDEKLFATIQDEGIGIPKDRQESIFDAFSQADISTTRKFGGTGLGLSISNAFVNKLGGVLKLESEENKGSKFYFSVPCKASTEIKEENPLSANIKFEGKILLVEDNTANQKLMQIILKKSGLTCDTANDGIEAIGMFKTNSYNAILMDENMPNMNGIEATKHILEYEKKNNLEHTPIIALTANALKGDRERFLKAGMDEYLTKPLDKNKLNKVLAKMLL